MMANLTPKHILYTSLLLILMSFVEGAVYNTTNLTNANNPYEQAKALNQITEGMIGYGLLIMTFMLVLIPVMGYSDAIGGISAASFATVIAATILLPLGFISFFTYQLTAIILGVVGFLSFLVRK